MKSRIAFAGVVLLVAVACQAPLAPPAAAPDHAAELGPKVDVFIEAWNTGSLDKLDEVMATDFKRRAVDEDVDGVEAMKDFMRGARTTYADLHIVVDETHYWKDAALVLWTVTGTNTGEGAFPPTGKSIDVSGMTLLKFRNGKLTHEIVQYDTAVVMEQLGIEGLPHASQGG